MGWKNRIIGHETADPRTLKANAANWRTHPKAQRKALADVLDSVGWVGEVLINKRSGSIVDGHLRVEEAIVKKEAEIPVLVVDLSEEEERLVLATLDPLSAMALTDGEALKDLLVEIGDHHLDDLLKTWLPKEAPEEFPSFDEDIETNYTCPKCGYEWS